MLGSLVQILLLKSVWVMLVMLILAALNDDATVDDVNTTLVDESSVDDGLFASNYTVTLKVTDAQVANVVANATALNAAGIDVIKPVEGT